MSDTNMEKHSDLPSSSPSASRKQIIRKYALFFPHLALTVLVATIVILVLDKRAFSTTGSHQPIFYQSDGNPYRLIGYFVLQSDITTALSLAATTTRIAAGFWSGGYIWRAFFVSMEHGGISLAGLSRAISHIPPGPRHFKQRSNMYIIYIIMFASLAIHYFSAILTGSITWKPDFALVGGSVPVSGIWRGVSGADLTDYFTNPSNRSSVLTVGVSSANLAWQTEPASAYTIDISLSRFRRIARNATSLPLNSTLNNITVPYFAVDNFEWIDDPESTLTNQQKLMFSDNSEFSPYAYGAPSLVAFLPDEQWGPPRADRLGDPHTVSETRVLSILVDRLYDNGTCGYMNPSNESQTNFYQVQAAANRTYVSDCFAIANVTYRAGVALCRDCPLVSAAVVQFDTRYSNATMLQDPFTSMALGLAPTVGTGMTASDYSIPRNYGTLQTSAVELVSRTYQAAWGAYSEVIGFQEELTDVQISLPSSIANVLKWRVYLWVVLHLSVLVLGLLFVHIQSQCKHPWDSNPTMTVFFLDSSAVHSQQGAGDLPGTEPSSNGMLTLENPSGNTVKVIMS